MDIENLTNDLKIILEAIKNGDNKDAEQMMKEIISEMSKFSLIL